MSREKAIDLLDNLIGMVEDNQESDYDTALKMGIQALSQEPCDKCVYSTKDGYCQYDDISETIPPLEPCTDAQERYEDLCEYFGDAKDILKSRKDFKAWLERVKWHIHKAEELYEKYEYKKEPCDDDEQLYKNGFADGYEQGHKDAEQKTGKWIPVSERLPETDDDVLVCDGVDMFVAWYSWKGMWQGWNSNDNNLERDTPIIAWMPLPKPYEPQESEEQVNE